jgi:hypothetical protein
VFIALIGPSSAFAAVEQCRFIQAKADREACYERQDRALAAKRASRAASDARTIEPVEQMTPEDDALKRSLRSICRGC